MLLCATGSVAAIKVPQVSFFFVSKLLGSFDTERGQGLRGNSDAVRVFFAHRLFFFFFSLFSPFLPSLRPPHPPPHTKTARPPPLRVQRRPRHRHRSRPPLLRRGRPAPAGQARARRRGRVEGLAARRRPRAAHRAAAVGRRGRGGAGLREQPGQVCQREEFFFSLGWCEEEGREERRGEEKRRERERDDVSFVSTSPP